MTETTGQPGRTKRTARHGAPEGPCGGYRTHGRHRATARWRTVPRRLSGALVVLMALCTLGAFYSVLAPTSRAAEDDQAAVRNGERLFRQTCVTCHGRNAQGVAGRGPSLVGVGEAAVVFQVATGRMPLARQEAQAPDKPRQFSDEEVRWLAAYIQSVGGGPEVPEGNLRDGDLARGGELFRLNCASCHNFAGRGNSLSKGKYAPAIRGDSDRIIYAAMLSGPQNMPTFGDDQITPDDKRAIINYIQTLNKDRDPGGLGLGRVGPVPEGLVIWLVGIGLLLVMTLWIGAKS